MIGEWGPQGNLAVTAFFYPTWSASLHPACLVLGFLRADRGAAGLLRGGLKALQ